MAGLFQADIKSSSCFIVKIKNLIKTNMLEKKTRLRRIKLVRSIQSEFLNKILAAVGGRRTADGKRGGGG